MNFTTEKTMRKPQRRLAMSQAEMADALGVSLATAGRMIRKRTVRSVKVGQRRLIPVSEIERLLSAAA
ncbi:helix-turn-helix domain-containing protein [Bradyrhizobium sp. AUGA SZCCT0042]|uniref:helix-turn-helix domain-containing protein n=1 Tax=Bradyrhizobium sp. AUGA SZCCT0042 TaxID=2807651 RepID=UPI001BAD9CC9|nr:helix-turn-helix domain-containing protein [Bradyrhizobium sp. AUGA SZCCT0042]MBR1301242.1 helix-turn-helix domain-containing protein [Bradyrhizobium sp. AUGA SZCCT0042]